MFFFNSAQLNDQVNQKIISDFKVKQLAYDEKMERQNVRIKDIQEMKDRKEKERFYFYSD